jgi:hypothetical protein
MNPPYRYKLAGSALLARLNATAGSVVATKPPIAHGDALALESRLKQAERKRRRVRGGCLSD